MNVLDIFGLQFALSMLVVSLLAAWVVRPWLRSQSLADSLFWLTIPHTFRHLGLVFLVPGVVAPTMPATFSGFAAFGDLAAGLLAIVALIALKRRWAVMLPLAWIANIVGTIDLANALSHTEAVEHFQSAWYIPTFVVPVLLVTHAMMFARLIGALLGREAEQQSHA